MRTALLVKSAAQLLCVRKINLTQVDGLRKPLMRDGIDLIHYRFFSGLAFGCALEQRVIN